VGHISVVVASTPTPAIALPADAFAKQSMPGTSTDWRALSVERMIHAERIIACPVGPTLGVLILSYLTG